jgi:hypothetical protein
MKKGNCLNIRRRMDFIHRMVLAAAVCILTFASPVLAQEAPEADNAVLAESSAAANEGPLGQSPSNDQNVSSSANESVSSAPAALSPQVLTFSDRVQIYRHSVFSPLTVIGPALGAGFGLWENEPPEWGQGMAGYGRRFGSSLGRTIINKTIVFGVAAMDGEDPRYIPSEQQGLMTRSRHAIVSTFVSTRADGSRMPAISLFAGAYGSAFIANAWYPPSKATTRHALEQGSTKLASTVGLHLLHEFWPDIRSALHFHHHNGH